MTNDQDINSRIDRIEVTLTHVTDTIEKLAAVINRPHETKWGPILTALSLLFIAASGYTTLITSPIQRENARLVQQMESIHNRELETAMDIGRLEGIMGVAKHE